MEWGEQASPGLQAIRRATWMMCLRRGPLPSRSRAYLPGTALLKDRSENEKNYHELIQHFYIGTTDYASLTIN